MAIRFLTGESIDGLITVETSTSSPLLNLYNTSNGSGSTIRFSDQTSQTQVGDITFYHSDSSSQGGGASWHFVSEPDTVLVVGGSSVNGRFVAKSAGSVGEVDYGFFDDVNTGMVRTSADNVSLVAGGVRGVALGTTAVSIRYAGSTKLATVSGGVDITGNGNFSGDITVSGGDITLGGTGRIQGVDTVSASTDAANKAYVDAHTSGIQTLTEGDGIKISGTTTATISVNYDAADADNLIQAATAVTSISGAPSGYAAYVLVAESNPGTTYGAVNKIRVSDIHLEDFGAAEGNINLNSNKITNLSTPTASADAANKSYVDSAVAGSPQGTVTGSGTSTRVAFWSSSSALSSDGDLFWDNTNKYLGVGTSLPANPLDVSGNFTLQGNQYMADNYQIILGNGSDLKIFHDGTDSRIQDSGNGLLKLQGSAVYLQHTTNGTTFTNMIEAISTYVRLNYSGSTKLATASNGVNITGLINITGDAYVQGGDIHMNSNINVISNSASDVNLIIGDVANNDSIESIDFHTFGQSQLTVFDDEITFNASNVILGSDSKFTTGSDSQIKYNATFSSSFKANGLFMPTGVGTSQSVTQGLLYALSSLGSWIAVQNSSSNSTQLLAIAAGTNVLSGMLLQGVFKSTAHGFAIGAPIYINSVSGTLTTTVPTASGAYARVVGHAVDSDFILFNPDNTWVRLA